MEYESAIRAFEAKTKKGPLGLFGSTSALIVQITPDTAHPLEAEMRHVNFHFLNWLSRHGSKCGELVLEFTATMSARPAIESQVSRLLLQDCQFNSIISRLKTECTIQDTTTGEIFELNATIRGSSAVPPQPPTVKDLADNRDEPNILGIRDPASPGHETLLFQAKDAALANAIDEARRRIPEFKALLDRRQAGVTVRVRWECGDVHDIYEASVVGRDGDQLVVEFTPDYAPGPVRKTYRFEELLDWTVYQEDGQKTGGFTSGAAQ